jgi:choline dehydrogenase-like flavoprotein
MIVDFESLQSDAVFDADVCIVGAGPAGLTLAHELAGTAHQVVVLEAGGFAREPAAQQLYDGRSTGHPYLVSLTRLRMFGGTSGIWHGQCGVILERHFKRRPGITDAAWPIDYSELEPHYRRAQELLELGAFDYDRAESRSEARGLKPSSDERLAPVIWHYRVPDPLRFGDCMRPEMERASNVRVLLHANVTALVTDAEATQVTKVRFSTLDGRTGVVRARTFVLACGGLETPRLLLNTDDVQRDGLGNARGLVGRNFMDHPSVVLGTIHLSGRRAATAMTLLADRFSHSGTRKGASSLTYCLSERFERAQNVGGGYYRFLAPGTTPAWMLARAQVAGGEGSLLERLHAVARYFDEWAYAKYREMNGYGQNFSQFDGNEVTVFVEFEQLPNAESRVSLTTERDRLGLRRLALNWQLTEHEARTVRAMGDALARELFLMGLGRLRLEEWLLEPGIERAGKFGYASHHIGTLRMADDPQFGVVDRHGRVFSCDNVYVAGSAVFPTSSFVNPTLTIVALACRMADHLKQRLA